MELLSLEEFLRSDYYIAIYCERIPQDDCGCTTHSGIITKIGGVRIFHFGWHERLGIHGIPQHKSVYVGLKKFSKQLDSTQTNSETFLQNLTTVCKHPNNAKLPYGLQFSNLIQLATGGTFTFNGRATGLTCSTFVMSIFKTY